MNRGAFAQFRCCDLDSAGVAFSGTRVRPSWAAARIVLALSDESACEYSTVQIARWCH